MQINLDQLIEAAVNGNLFVEYQKMKPTAENIAAEAFRMGLLDDDELSWDEGVAEIRKQINGRTK